MEQFWTQIQPHIVIIIANIATMTTIWATRSKKSEQEKAKEDLKKQRKKTQKDKTKLEKDLKREAELEEILKNE